MTDHSPPALKFVDVFKALAKARYDLPTWVAWWEEHKAEVEAALLPGWTLKLKPRGEPLQTLRGSQAGACFILDALKVPYNKSDRYKQEWKEGFSRFYAEQKAKEKEKARQYEPAINAIAKHFPKFARFFKKRASHIDCMEPPITEAQLVEIERSLRVALPQAYKQFLLCTRSLRIEAFEFSRCHPDLVSSSGPTKGMVSIADYFLEADGDQVLFAATDLGEADPPVFYYAHAGSPPHVRQIGTRFSTWLESLPKSPMFE